MCGGRTLRQSSVLHNLYLIICMQSKQFVASGSPCKKFAQVLVLAGVKPGYFLPLGNPTAKNRWRYKPDRANRLAFFNETREFYPNIDSGTCSGCSGTSTDLQLGSRDHCREVNGVGSVQPGYDFRAGDASHGDNVCSHRLFLEGVEAALFFECREL